MRSLPKEMTLREILSWASRSPIVQQGMIDENGEPYWLPARSLSYWPGPITRVRHRLRCAWLVFAGRADVLHWR